jgi:hypothetical protein
MMGLEVAYTLPSAEKPYYLHAAIEQETTLKVFFRIFDFIPFFGFFIQSKRVGQEFPKTL